MIQKEDVSSRTYTITYRNVLKHDKVIGDFREWLKSYWDLCRFSGAKALRLWRYHESGKSVLLWQFTVDNLERWQNHILDENMQRIFHDLDTLVEPDHLGVEVCHCPGNQTLPVNELFLKISLN